jgi:ankyrin repeat protein
MRFNVKRSVAALFLAASVGTGIYGAAKAASAHADYLLQVAARAGFAPAIKPVLLLGANIRPAEVDDDPLWQAAHRGHTETVRALLDGGASIHRRNDWALRLAAEYGRTETVKLLLARGADVHAGKDAALRLAANNGHTETVKALLAAGADARAANGEALAWALENGHGETARVLRQAAAKEGRGITKDYQP